MKKTWNSPTLTIIGNQTIKGNGDTRFTYEDVCYGSCVTTAGCVNTTPAGCNGSIRYYDTGIADSGWTCAAGTGAVPACS